MAQALEQSRITAAAEQQRQVGSIFCHFLGHQKKHFQLCMTPATWDLQAGPFEHVAFFGFWGTAFFFLHAFKPCRHPVTVAIVKKIKS